MRALDRKSHISFVALHTGSYYLMVYGLTGAGSVPYEISTQVVRDDVPPGTLPTLTLGAAAAGRIDHSADTDSFGIHLVRGKT